MPKIIASIIAHISYPAALVFFRLSDGSILKLLGLARRATRGRKTLRRMDTVLGDVEKIFRKRLSSGLARRMLREVRPAQFKAVVKGALR